MKRFHVTRAIVALMIGIVAVPAVMTGLNVPLTPQKAIYNSALSDATRVRAARRQYWKAVEVYNGLTRIGFSDFPLTPPDINNMASIEFYLDDTNFSVTGESLHLAAPDANDAVQDEYNALPERRRDLLDGYVATGYCPTTLTMNELYLVGFYELCNKLLEQKADILSDTLLMRSAYLRRTRQVGNAGPSLKDRLKVLENTLLGVTQGAVRPKGTPGQRRPRITY